MYSIVIFDPKTNSFLKESAESEEQVTISVSKLKVLFGDDAKIDIIQDSELKTETYLDIPIIFEDDSLE